MSHHRSNDYEDHKDYLDYGYSDNQEESYESESNEEEDNGNGVLENKGNISPLFCKGHSTSYSGDCAHCRKLSHDQKTSQKNTRLLGGIYICGNRTPLYYSYSR